MPEQSNSVSNGLSPMLKTTNTGSRESTSNADSVAIKGSLFSSDLDQARRHQLSKAGAESAQAPGTRQGNQGPDGGSKSAPMSTANVRLNEADESRLTQGALSDTQSNSATADRLLTVKVDQSVTETDQPLAVLVNPEGADVVDRQSTVSGRAMAVAATSSANSGDNAMVNPDALQILQQQGTALDDGARKGSKADMVTPGTPASGDRILANVPNPSAATAVGQPGSIAPVGADGNPATAASGVDAGVGVNTISSVGSQLSVDPAVAMKTASGSLATNLSGETSQTPSAGMDLTKIASGNGVVTQAVLAGRFRLLSNDTANLAAADVAATLLQTGDSDLPVTQSAGLIQKGVAALSHASLPLGDIPPANNGTPGIKSLMGVPDVNATVQQRIATAEAILSQMAMETGDGAVKSTAADNMYLAMSGGTVTAAAGLRNDSAAGSLVQAPLNIPLTSDDAETALAGNVKWMTNEGVKNAVMTVTPHGMGPISVKIGIEGNQMEVSIIASQHTTREALESMLPRLREQLVVQGHDSVKVDVSDGKNEQSRTGNGQGFAESRNSEGASSQDDNPGNGSNQGEKAEFGGADSLDLVSESFMAEDLQRDARRVGGEVQVRPVFDAYV